MEAKLIPLGKPTTIQIVGSIPEQVNARALLLNGLRGPVSRTQLHIVPCLGVEYATKSGMTIKAVGTTSKLFGGVRFPPNGFFLYVIFSVEAAAVYVGSTTNLMRRLCSHRTGLTKGDHRNTNLIEMFKEMGADDLELMFLSFDSISEDQLRDIEQEMLNAALSIAHLKVLNKSHDVKVFGKGLVRSDAFKERARQFKQKGVNCGGVLFDSLTTASESLSVSKTQIHRRLNSEAPQWSNWTYVK